MSLRSFMRGTIELVSQGFLTVKIWWWQYKWEKWENCTILWKPDYAKMMNSYQTNKIKIILVASYCSANLCKSSITLERYSDNNRLKVNILQVFFQIWLKYQGIAILFYRNIVSSDTGFEMN